jgi:hypothetical protein
MKNVILWDVVLCGVLLKQMFWRNISLPSSWQKNLGAKRNIKGMLIQEQENTNLRKKTRRAEGIVRQRIDQGQAYSTCPG